MVKTEPLIPSPVLLASRQPREVFLLPPLCPLGYQVCLSLLNLEPTSAFHLPASPHWPPPCSRCPHSHPPPPTCSHHPRVTSSAHKGPHSPVSAGLSRCTELCFLSTSQPPGLCSCCSLYQKHPSSLSPPLEPTPLACATSACPSGLNLDVPPPLSQVRADLCLLQPFASPVTHCDWGLFNLSGSLTSLWGQVSWWKEGEKNRRPSMPCKELELAPGATGSF